MRRMSEARTYEGSCHCGAVQFTAQLDLSEPVMACNCSICSRAGWLLTFVPEASVQVTSGRDQLTDYQFGKKQLHHVFCRVCGIHAFCQGAGPDGAMMYAVNARCLAGVDPEALQVTRYDGKSL